MRRMLLFVGSIAAPVLIVLVTSTMTMAGGIGLEITISTIDLTATLPQVPAAVDGAFSAIEEALNDLGIPAEALDELAAEFDNVLNELEGALADVPLLVPIPHFGGSIAFTLPFVVIDELRFSGGIINDTLMRGIADLFDLVIPQPLLIVEIEEDTFEASFTADLSVSSFVLSTELVKRFDLAIAGLDLGLGVALMQGSVRPTVDYTVPPQFQEGTEAALAALHLNDISWSVFGVHGLIGFGLGPSFLQLFVEGRYFLPVSQSPGWWGIKAGHLAGSIGLRIRF